MGIFISKTFSDSEEWIHIKEPTSNAETTYWETIRHCNDPDEAVRCIIEYGRSENAQLQRQVDELKSKLGLSIGNEKEETATLEELNVELKNVATRMMNGENLEIEIDNIVQRISVHPETHQKREEKLGIARARGVVLFEEMKELVKESEMKSYLHKNRIIERSMDESVELEKMHPAMFITTFVVRDLSPAEQLAIWSSLSSNFGQNNVTKKTWYDDLTTKIVNMDPLPIKLPPKYKKQQKKRRKK